MDGLRCIDVWRCIALYVWTYIDGWLCMHVYVLMEIYVWRWMYVYGGDFYALMELYG